MKTLTLILALTFSVMLSSTSFADWKKVTEDAHATYYVDFEGIRNRGQIIYWWNLTNYLLPDPVGDFSNKTYVQGNCKLFRIKYLSYIHYKRPMGAGIGRDNIKKEPEWHSPHPIYKKILKSVCAYAK
jgi:hypothetical protein